MGIYGRVYCITNTSNNKRYIGQTIRSIDDRFRSHCWESCKDKSIISKAIAKYGVSNFRVEQLCVCYNAEDLDETEKECINFYETLSPNGYNMEKGGGSLGEVSRKKLSNIAKGKKLSAESIAKRTKTRREKGPSEKLIKMYQDFGVRASQRLKSKPLKVYSFINPNNEVQEIIGLKQFCLENDLNFTCMLNVFSGRFKSHKGWRSCE